MKKADFVVFFGVLLVAGAVFSVTQLTKTHGDTVVIAKDGNIFGEYSLYESAQISVGNTNTVQIENGTAYMLDATCPDKLCIRQGKASDSSKTIVCLPNRVTVEVTKKSEIDKVVR